MKKPARRTERTPSEVGDSYLLDKASSEPEPVAAEDLSTEEERAIEDRLRYLGYID